VNAKQVDKKPEAPPKPKEGANFYFKTSAAYNQTSTKQDYSGFIQKQSDTVTPSASGTIGLKYRGTPRSFGSQPVFDATYSTSYSDTSSRSSSSKLEADSSDPEAVRNVTSRSESTGYQLEQVMGIQGLVPLSEPIDVGAGFEQTDTQGIAGGVKGKTSAQKASVQSVIEISSIKADLSYESETTTDLKSSEKNQDTTTMTGSLSANGDSSTTNFTYIGVENSKPKLNNGIQSSMSLGLSWDKSFDDYGIAASVNQTTKTRDEDALDESGNQFLQVLNFKIEGTYTTNVGITGTMSYTQFKYDNIVIRGASAAEGEETPEAMANGTGNQYKVSIKAAPVSFVSLSVSWEYTNRKLAIGEPTLEKTMVTGIWSTQNKTTLNLGVNYSF
jgi:hypothetical protein